VTFLALHLIAGALTGALFRVQTLAMLAMLVLLEAAWASAVHESASTALWALGAEAMLQFGYIAGVCGRDMFERSGPATRAAHVTPGSSRRPDRGD
jgi:hypothetical protein